MKRSIAMSFAAMVALSVCLMGCAPKESAKVEVKDELLGDGKEVKIETPKGDAEIELPAAESR